MPRLQAQATLARLHVQSGVVFLGGDRIDAGPACTPLVARLQQPDHLARILAAKFPGAAVIM